MGLGGDPASTEVPLPLTRASAGGSLAVVEYLLRQAAVSPATRGNEALLAACRNGHTHVVRRLIVDRRVRAVFRAQGRRPGCAVDAARAAGHKELACLLDGLLGALGRLEETVRARLVAERASDGSGSGPGGAASGGSARPSATVPAPAAAAAPSVGVAGGKRPRGVASAYSRV